MKLESSGSFAYRAAIEDESKLWHRRYGHFGFRALCQMQSEGHVRDLPLIKDCGEICECCQMGKQHRLPFPSHGERRASEKLELIHTDLCGPMNTSSLSNNKYFLLFIDDHTRMAWIYFLTYKSQVFGVFKKFKAMVETQSGCRIKTLRSDNGKEYTSKEFNQFCEDMGVEHQLTVSYTPQQNGVAERKNRTVMEMTRCLMIEKDLPKRFWAEAAYTAVYLLNRLPARAIGGMTPIEAWTGHKPTAKHLKVFGSVCYMHVPAVKRDKLEAKSQKGIFLGYSSISKGYRIYNLKTSKVDICRDLQVDEDASWNWDSNELRKNLTNAVPDPLIVQTNEDGIEGPDSSSTSVSESDSETHSSSRTSSSPESPILRTRALRDVYESCNFAATEPSCFEEASKHKEWVKAMESEMEAIESNDTWELVERPTYKKPIGVKWIYKSKLNADGSINKFKARLVVKGYAQQEGLDYGDTFAPVARMDTIRLLLALAAQQGWNVFQLDVKSAFLNGTLEEEIFVEQPEGFLVKNSGSKVYKLKKALYGLKQAPRAWYAKIDSYLIQQGFKKSESEATLYVRTFEDGDVVVISLYVDDLLITGGSLDKIRFFKDQFKQVFAMTDLGQMRYFLGMEVQQDEDGIFLSQRKFALEILKKFKMEDCKIVSTPLAINTKLLKEDGDQKTDERNYRSLVGHLLYLCATRPDLMYAASLLSRFMNSPSQTHFGAAKRVLRYLKGSLDFGLKFGRVEGSLFGYSDSDWAGSADDCKSTTGYVFSLGHGCFSWNSKKQEVVAQSTAEAEYIAAATAANQAIWLRKILQDLGFKQKEATLLNVDNQSAIAIAKNPVQHGKTKHIKVKYHFIRQAEKEGEINLRHCSTEDQVADILTKALPKTKFCKLREMLGVVCNYSRRSVEK